MTALDPQLFVAASTTVVAATMVVLGRRAELLEQTQQERCAACGRLLDSGDACSCGH